MLKLFLVDFCQRFHKTLLLETGGKKNIEMLHTKSVLAMFHYFLSDFALCNYILKNKEFNSPLGNENLLALAFIVRFYTMKQF